MIGLVAAVGAMLGLGADARPVRAETSWSGNTVRIRLVGRSAERVSVHYRVTASDGSNRADQSGDATLDSDREVTLLDLSQSAGAAWSATIEVTGPGIAPYRLTLHRPGQASDPQSTTKR